MSITRKLTPVSKFQRDCITQPTGCQLRRVDLPLVSNEPGLEGRFFQETGWAAKKRDGVKAQPVQAAPPKHQLLSEAIANPTGDS